jgi:hypothetical protein
MAGAGALLRRSIPLFPGEHATPVESYPEMWVGDRSD